MKYVVMQSAQTTLGDGCCRGKTTSVMPKMEGYYGSLEIVRVMQSMVAE
jgi:hypothetical protein